MLVKVEIVGETARIRSENGEVDMQVHADIVKRRMGTARIAFFSAETKRGQLEIGDHADWQTW